jgi:sodium-dependent dicarboxylate transporter 2/3/5
MIPSSNNSTLLTFRDLLKLPWGVLFLFGDGLSIATAFIDSNLIGWFSEHLSKLTNYSYCIVLILFIAAVIFMTEIMSNTAISNLFIPVAISMSSVMNIEPYGLMAVVTLSSTCAFMLPVATPPNAVVFGNKYLQPNDMIKVELKMNLLSIIVIVAAVYFWLPHIKIN